MLESTSLPIPKTTFNGRQINSSVTVSIIVIGGTLRVKQRIPSHISKHLKVDKLDSLLSSAVSNN